MKLSVSFLSLSVLFIAWSCKQPAADPDWKELPNVMRLDSLQRTDFMPTLENPVNEGRNSIYAPSLLYAWNELRTTLGSPIIVPGSASLDLNYLNRSQSYKQSLESGEYTVNTTVESNLISIRSFFHQTLPFPSLMDKLEEPMMFEGTPVAGFGMQWRNEEIINFSRILYYRSDDAFVLKFIPKDERHEIILVKGFNNVKDLSEAITITGELITSGKKEKEDRAQTWKYVFNMQDVFLIPVIKFNIATHYKSIEGQGFKSGGEAYHIGTAYQRTGFILNESGAVVESEARVDALSAALEGPDAPNKPHPKKMIFDKPFLIIVKKKGQANPYFVMKVENTELMQKK